MATKTAIWECKKCHARTKHHAHGKYPDGTTCYRCSVCDKRYGKLAPKQPDTISKVAVLPNKKTAPKPHKMEQKTMSADITNTNQNSQSVPTTQDNNGHNGAKTDFVKLFADLRSAGYTDEQIKSMIDSFMKNPRLDDNEEPTERPVIVPAPLPAPDKQPLPTTEPTKEPVVVATNHTKTEMLERHRKQYYQSRLFGRVIKWGLCILTGYLGFRLFADILPSDARGFALGAVVGIEGSSIALDLMSDGYTSEQQKSLAFRFELFLGAIMATNAVLEVARLVGARNWALNFYGIYCSPALLGGIFIFWVVLFHACRYRARRTEIRASWIESTDFSELA